MADFDLTQTDQQVQNILNDGQSAMGAGAQTTLTTEYVMLKDTSGVYHKILKSSFTEAIRDVLAGLLVNNDKGTTISQIAAIASGDFGSVTPANLASVLGASTLLEKEIQIPAYSTVNFPTDELKGKVFYARNGSYSSINATFCLTGLTSINRVSYSVLNGLKIESEQGICALVIAVVNSALVIQNTVSETQRFIYRPLL